MAITLNERRIGAYGGTFDPPHDGHMEVARAVARHFELDQLLIIPAHRPPHKDQRSISNAYHRYAMAALAMLSEPGFKVSTVEIESPDKPYTFETVERLKSLYGPGAKLFFVMGADSFMEIDTWREPARLLESTNVIVAARPGVEITTSHLPAGFEANVRDIRGRAEAEAARVDERCCYIYITDYVRKDISSTEIRQRVRDGGGISGLVPPCVAEYINKYELYRR